MSAKKTIQIAEAKGRPMLQWVGKSPLAQVTVFPAQQLETFDPTDEKNAAAGLIFHGDNRDVLAWLLANGYRERVDLVYIDPPFDSGADYVRRVNLRGIKGSERLEGGSYSLGEQIQYNDIWVNDTYLQFMYERLLLLKELLSETGGIVVHCDWHQGHRIRLIMDEVFGEGNFRNELIWHYGQRTAIREKRLDMKHDSLLFYAKSDSMELNETSVHWDYKEFMQRRHDVLTDESGREYIYADGGPGGQRYIRYVEDVIAAGKPLDSVWDLPLLNSSDRQRQGFPTQKPDYLVERILRVCSFPGDTVLDCFVGSGTTAAVAQKLGRCWIVADINQGAIQLTSKRLQTIIQEQIKARSEPQQLALASEGNSGERPAPVALSFSVYRVNDYDLQIQHNEAVNLAVELIGIERSKTDSYFDGTLGRRLAKIVPFNHPLTLLDLEQLQQELGARPQEERDIVLVCLGKESTIDPWLENYNRHRPINRIEVIELRTDQKYGKFFLHQPAQAEVSIERRDGQIVVDIQDFISPTIVERLEMDMPLFKAEIPDWRAMVDAVMIDTDYDGEVLDINLSDVPERKDDLVEGHYELPAPDAPTTVAVKIIDMLGEEVLVTKQV